MTICKATLSIADDHGDNSATIHCQLEEGHIGPHTEKFFRNADQAVEITWLRDESNDDRMFAYCNNCKKNKEIKWDSFRCKEGEETFDVEYAYDSDPYEKPITPCPFCGQRTLVIKNWRDIFDPMHNTIVKMKDGRTFCGPMCEFSPLSGSFSIVAEGTPDVIMFRDVESVITKDERVNAEVLIKDVDELARARENGWDGK
jgi:hypothetical protein